MEEACEKAMAQQICSYTYFVKLLEKREADKPLIHENLRGKDYYKGGSHV
jgi:hypothetical protein